MPFEAFRTHDSPPLQAERLAVGGAIEMPARSCKNAMWPVALASLLIAFILGYVFALLAVNELINN